MRKGMFAVLPALVLVLAFSVTALAAPHGNDIHKSRLVNHTMTFDSAGGSKVAPQVVNEGSLSKKPKDPVKYGHIFKGWYCNGVLFDFNKMKVDKNCKLIAKWEMKPITTPVTVNLEAYHTAVNEWYDLHDALNADTVDTAESIAAARNLLNTHPDVGAHGQAVIGSYSIWDGERWLNEEKKYSQSEIDGWTVKLNAVLEEAKALLEAKHFKWTVTFDSDGGSAVGAQQVEPGGLLTKPQDPVKDGYNFTGWYYISPDYVTLFNFADMRINWDITLTATWAAKDNSKTKDNPKIKPDLKVKPDPKAKPDLKDKPDLKIKPDLKTKPDLKHESITVSSATPSAVVEKQNGNKNNLEITLVEKYSDGSSKTITKTFSINNNAAATYEVGGYKIYVDTKGNTQIRACYIVN